MNILLKMQNIIRNTHFNQKAGILIALTAILYAGLLNNINLWSDEIYSVLMAKDSFSDMWELLSTEDSKPPLYYLYLKFMLLFFPEQYEIFGAHFASYILLIVAQIFTATAVKKDYGEKISLSMITIIALMPHSLWLAFEVRTYMLSALLLYVALIYGLRLIKAPQKQDFIKFGIVTILALYTHYYCAIYLMILYLILFIKLLHNKKNLISLLITSTVVALCFAPWLIVPLTTGSQISQDWYVNWDFVRMSPMFFYDPLAPDILQSVLSMATFILTASFTFIVFTSIYIPKNEQTLETRQLLLTALLSFFITYLMLILLSVIVRPLLTSRYLKIFSLIWYMAGAIAIANYKVILKAFITVAIICFPLTYIDLMPVVHDTSYKIARDEINQFIPKNKRILALDNSNLFCEYYLPRHRCVLIAKDTGEILRKNKVKQNIRLYTEKQDEIVYTISTYTKVDNTACRIYDTIYRNGNNIALCKITKEYAEHLIRATLHRLNNE